jgi:hypothetical protein
VISQRLDGIPSWPRLRASRAAGSLQRSIQGAWLKALLVALFGYAMLGKGFAYLFLGEVILFLGVLVFLRSRRFGALFNDPCLFIWTLFGLLGVVRTLPYLSTYGFDAVRDAVLWGYGLVALLVSAFIDTTIRISRTLNAYRRFLFWYLPMLPVLVYASVALRDYLPVIPWSDQSTILLVKAGDAGVHLCGAALFALLFVRRETRGWRRQVSLPGILAFVGWSASSLIVLIVSRGGFAAMMIPILLVSIWMPRRVGWKVAIAGVFTSTLALLILTSNVVTIHVKGRDFTARDVIELVTATASGSDKAAGHEGTLEWRLSWWTKIIDDTVYGPHFWTGQGFGINLAAINDPKSLSDDEAGLRSPHNVTMTVLARMGIPGLVLWIALNGIFAIRLLRCHLAANRRREEFWSRLYLWIFCYWLAALINATFDVYLEGPQGGILFWSLMGLGIAAMRVHAFERRSEAAPAAAILDPEPRMPNLLDASGYPASP